MRNLNLFGPVTDRTGYGVFVLNLARELNKLFTLTLTPRSQVQDPNIIRDPVLHECMERARDRFDYTAPGINIWHAHNMQQFYSGERIGFPIFEGDLIKEDAALHLMSLDRIAVTSKWAADVIKCNLDWPDDKLAIINGGVDPLVFNDQDPVSIPAIDQFTGRKAINVGKWEIRKGHEEIIRYLSVLRPSLTFFGMWDNVFWPGWRDKCVELLYETGWSPVDHTKAVWKTGTDTYLVLLGWVNSHPQYAEILKKMDFAVFPYRAEGWCLPLHECMACGLPVVATNYSAPTEFLTEECGYLLNNGTMEPIYDQVHFPDGGHGEWMVPDQDELTAGIDHLMNDETYAAQAGRNAMKQAHKFTWEAAAKKLAEQL